MVYLIERDGLARGVACREVHSFGACYRVQVYTWEWGGLTGQWLEEGVGAGVAAGGAAGPQSWAGAIHAVGYGI